VLDHVGKSQERDLFDPRKWWKPGKKTRDIGNSVVAFSGARQADFHSINLEMVALLQMATLCFSHTGFNSQNLVPTAQGSRDKRMRLACQELW
jgi:hypothetical protein